MKPIETFIIVLFAQLLYNSLLEISCIEWPVGEFPDPQIDFKSCGLDEQGFVCDPDEILDVGDRRNLDQLIKEFHKASNGTCIDRCGKCDSYPGIFIGVAIADRIYDKEFEKTELIEEVTTTVATSSYHSGEVGDGLNFDIDDYLKKENAIEYSYDYNEMPYEDDYSYDKDFFEDYGVSARGTRRNSRSGSAYDARKSERNFNKKFGYNTNRRKQVRLLLKRHKSHESYETKRFSVLHPNIEYGNKNKELKGGDYNHKNINYPITKNNSVEHPIYDRIVDKTGRSYDLDNEAGNIKSEHKRLHHVADDDTKKDRKSHKGLRQVTNDDTINDKSSHMSHNVADGHNHNRKSHKIHHVSSDDINEMTHYTNHGDVNDDYNNYDKRSKSHDDVAHAHPANAVRTLDVGKSSQHEYRVDYDENLLPTQKPKIRVTNDPPADWAEYLALKKWNWQQRLPGKEKNCQNTVVILLYAHKKQAYMVGGSEVRYYTKFPTIVQQTKHFFINHSNLQSQNYYKGLRAIIDSYWSHLKESNFKGGDDYKTKMTTVIIILVVLGAAVIGFIVFICVDVNKTERKFSKANIWKTSFSI